ncbi:MAG: DNA primase [Planctomycetes bacterium]|nr:DNA primase [Planctomycetota bacterium]
MTAFVYGFRILGNCTNSRRLVDATAALAGCAACDELADLDRESYLSAFQFGADFRRHLESTGSTKGYSGETGTPWLWFDIDRADPQAATNATRRLSAACIERYGVVDDDLFLFFSGSKGYHVGLPTALWAPQPSIMFHRVARRFAEQVAEVAGISIDTGVYDRVRAFRAPNSRHPKTGLHKRRLTVKELMHLRTDAIRKLAQEAVPFDIPNPDYRNEQAETDWQRATEQVRQETEALKERRANGDGNASLNRQTLAFIRDGASVGDRHRLLFSSAANLAEFKCPAPLAHALLSESALDSGLPPSDVRRQIDCGLNGTEGVT